MPMKAYLVTARTGSSNSDRYIDSIWISQDFAMARRTALRVEFDRAGKDTTNAWNAWVTEVQIEDAAEVPKEPIKAAPTKKAG